MKLFRFVATAILAAGAIALSVGAAIEDPKPPAVTPLATPELDHHEELAILLARIDRTLESTTEVLHESASDAERAAHNLGLVQEQGRSVLEDIDRILELECDCCGDGTGAS